VSDTFGIAQSPSSWLTIAFLIVLCLYLTVGLAGSMIRARRINYDDLPWKDEGFDPTNYDCFWFLGFYNNPDDYELFVPARRMWGRRALNVGRPLGLAWMIVVLLMIIFMIVVFLYL
jgi:uncharacterized membrane protein